MIKQLFGTMYTVFCAKCLPRLWDEQFQDEAHVRREMEAEAHGGLVGWNFPATERNINAIVEYAIASWEHISLVKKNQR